MSDYFIALKNKNIRLDLAFEPEINEWNNVRRLQLKIDDLHIHALERHVLAEYFQLMRRKVLLELLTAEFWTASRIIYAIFSTRRTNPTICAG